MHTKLKMFYIATLTAAGLYLLLVDWGALWSLDPRELGGLAAFVALATLSEHMAVDASTGRRVRSSVAFLPLLALTILFPAAAVALAVILMFVGYGIRSVRNWRSFAFNLAQMLLAYGAAGALFHLLRGGAAFGADLDQFLGLFFPFYGAVVTYFGLNILLVSAYIAIRDKQKLKVVIAEATGRGGGNFFYDLLASPVAFAVAYLYWTFHVAGLVAVVLPLLLIRYSYLSAVQLDRANRDLLRVLIKAIETRDPYTSGHSLRVSTLARAIAEDMGLRGRAVKNVEDAALLHDIGKIDALYSEIISKESSLTTEEHNVIRTHATKGADLLQSLTSLEKDIIVGVRHHHERYDGTGYPDQLAGKDIPLAARIIMICDAVDAMLSDRPYRSALPVSEVKAELLRCAGTQFDPDVVEDILENSTLEKAEILVDRSGARAPVRAVG